MESTSTLAAPGVIGKKEHAGLCFPTLRALANIERGKDERTLPEVNVAQKSAAIPPAGRRG